MITLLAISPSPRCKHNILTLTKKLLFLAKVSNMIYLQWLCVPFLLLNPLSTNIAQTAFNHTFQAPWVGTLEMDKMWNWIDDFLMLVSRIFTLFLFPSTKSELNHMLVEQTTAIDAFQFFNFI